MVLVNNHSIDLVQSEASYNIMCLRLIEDFDQKLLSDLHWDDPFACAEDQD